MNPLVFYPWSLEILLVVAAVTGLVGSLLIVNLRLLSAVRNLQQRSHPAEGLDVLFEQQSKRIQQEIEHAVRQIVPIAEQPDESAMVGGSLDRKRYVAALARQGLSTHDISKRLNMTLGETELVLGLSHFARKERDLGQRLH